MNGNLSLRPGIAGDGSLVAFAGATIDGASGIFGYETDASNGLTHWISVNSEAMNAVSQVRGIDFSDRVGVEPISSFFNNQLRLAFNGTNDDNETALYTARIDRNTGNVFGLTPVVSIGSSFDVMSSLGVPQFGPLTDFAINDPVNSVGQITFNYSTADGSGVAIYSGPRFTKYKQVPDDTPLNSNDETRWWDKPIRNNSPTLFADGGCFIAALATISGIYGQEITPLRMRDFLESQGLLDPGGVLLDRDPNSAFTRPYAPVMQVGQKAINVRSRGGTYDDIVAELRAGNPVMLAVPSSDQILHGRDGKYHAIVAYGIDPSLGENDEVEPSHIFVSDPGWTSYHLPGYTDSEEAVNVTLEDFFLRTSVDTPGRSRPFGFEAKMWFNQGAFMEDNGGTVRLQDLNPNTLFFDRNMTFFDAYEVPLGGIASHLVVQSPVELVIQDRDSGMRFVSDSSLAFPGDVVLSKEFFDLTAAPDFLSDGSIPEFVDEEFPPYALVLPQSLRGSDLDVELLGIGEGDYTVTLYTGDPNLVPSAPLIGNIEVGQTVFAEFEVSAVTNLAGDYNGNGVVDAADYVVWRNHEGSEFDLPNRDPNLTGDIGQADYAFWVANFGNSASGAAPSARIPEPSMWILLFQALGFGVWVGKGKR
jgi:hypothetical protein